MDQAQEHWSVYCYHWYHCLGTFEIVRKKYPRKRLESSYLYIYQCTGWCQVVMHWKALIRLPESNQWQQKLNSVPLPHWVDVNGKKLRPCQDGQRQVYIQGKVDLKVSKIMLYKPHGQYQLELLSQRLVLIISSLQAICKTLLDFKPPGALPGSCVYRSQLK